MDVMREDDGRLRVVCSCGHVGHVDAAAERDVPELVCGRMQVRMTAAPPDARMVRD